MQKKFIFLYAAIAIMLVMIGKAFILNEGVKYYLLIFMVVGFGLAFLRLGVNGAIKKMKGKSIAVKILFFAVLLGFGIPFQNWFRKDVLLAMSSDYLLPCIIVTASSMIFMTILYGIIYERKRVPYLSKK